MWGDVTQLGKRLRVITFLDGREKQEGDPFLLTSVQGSEDISPPFRFELQMHRDPERPYLYPSELVATQIHFGIRLQEVLDDEQTAYSFRTGVVEQAEIRYLSQTVKANVWLYKLVVVPAFKMLDREVIYRVFENMDVRQILHEVLGDVPKLDVDFGGIASEQFDKMPYCVQFGESTFNFASRLMARFGIWYYFAQGEWTTGPDVPHRNGRMTLGRSKLPNRACAWADLKVRDLKETGELDDGDAVARCSQIAIPAVEWIRVGNFNPLKPAAPFTQSANVTPRYDILVDPGQDVRPEERSHFKSEVFASPVFDNAQAGVSAKTLMNAAEAGVVTYTGITKNPTMLAGFLVNIVGSDPSDKTRKTPGLITHLEISAFELGYEYNLLTNTWLVFRKVVAPLEKAQGWADITANVTAQGIGNWLQNQFPYNLQTWWHPDSMRGDSPNQNIPYFDTFAVGGMLATVNNLITALTNAIEQVAQSEGDDYSNSFQAICGDRGNPPGRVPLPQARRPVAHGPHLAVVIGRSGTGGSNDIYADALGRVRVRFPWQRQVPKDSPADDTDPLKSDRRTCWLRVSQAWAGRRFGAQFLPRIGQEVIVSFLDGDPDQPIITGSVYNADSAMTNLPFPSNVWGATPLGSVTGLASTAGEALPLSGIETRSTPMPRDDKGNPTEKIRYHLLRFDDTNHDEQLLLRSQGRLDVTAKASRYETTEGDRHVLVIPGKDAHDQPVGGSAFTSVSGEYDLMVGKDRYERVGGGYQLSVKGDTQLHLEGDLKARVSGNLSLNATTIVLEAAEKITLRVGGSTIVLNATAVFHDGPFVKKQSGGPADVADPVTMKDVAGAAKADPGEPPGGRSPAASGGSGGQRGEHRFDALHDPGWTPDYSGMISIGYERLSSGGDGE